MVRVLGRLGVRMTFSSIRVASGQGLRNPPLIGLGFIIQHRETSGPAGANVVNFNTRKLNTQIVNTIAGAILGVNKFTLPAGTFEVVARATAVNVVRHRLFLFNLTDAPDVLQLEDGLGNLQLEDGSGDLQLETTYPIIGLNHRTNPSAGSDENSTAMLRGRLTISGAKEFELHHWMQEVQATHGLGLAASGSELDQIFVQINILKV